MPNFTSENRTALMSDIARSYLFEWTIPTIKDVTNGKIDQEGLIIRVKKAVIPGLEIEELTTYFMGMEQKFQGRAKNSGNITLDIDETEDMIVLDAINEWQKNIFDIDPNSHHAGYSSKPNKRARCVKSYLKLYKYNGTLMPKMFVINNCWINNREPVNLNMEGNEKISVSVSLAYDFWTLEKAY